MPTSNMFAAKAQDQDGDDPFEYDPFRGIRLLAMRTLQNLGTHK